jgi:hypothetical protein
MYTVENEAKTSQSNMILIPESALIRQGQLTGIYTIGNGNGHPEMAAYRENFGNQIEVLSGLSADERYIASAEGKLFNGAKVSVQ